MPLTQESNCVLQDCTTQDKQCDTQVYVTWKGTDKDGVLFQSDEKRISGFTDFDVKSYYEAALDLPQTTYYYNVWI